MNLILLNNFTSFVSKLKFHQCHKVESNKIKTLVEFGKKYPGRLESRLPALPQFCIDWCETHTPVPYLSLVLEFLFWMS